MRAGGWRARDTEAYLETDRCVVFPRYFKNEFLIRKMIMMIYLENSYTIKQEIPLRNLIF